jgi:hypothetical protein
MTEGTDTVVVVPLLKDLTYNEAHSALLGLVGILAGVGYREGFREVVAGFTVVAVLVAFGLRRMDGDRLATARRIVRREPWYFLTIYVLSSVGAALAYGAL